MKNLEFFKGVPFAHRGLHNNKDIPENSMAAFARAVEHGFGIEFDVYLTDDGHLIVHHDPTLKRSCGIDVASEKIDGANLEKYRLFGTQEHIPYFKDVLALVNGKVKLIIEIKITDKYPQTCAAVIDALKDYKGDFCIESFDPRTVLWLQKNCPKYLIGQLYDPNPVQRIYCRLKGTHKDLAFMAASVKTLKSRFYQNVKKHYPGTALVTWTVRTPDQLSLAKDIADNYIFEYNDKNPQYIDLPSCTD